MIILKYGVNKKNIVKIPNGIDVNYYSKNYPSSIFRKKHNLSSKKIILFIGRIDEIKGTDLLINSFICFPLLSFYINVFG